MLSAPDVNHDLTCTESILKMSVEVNETVNIIQNMVCNFVLWKMNLLVYMYIHINQHDELIQGY